MTKLLRTVLVGGVLLGLAGCGGGDGGTAPASTATSSSGDEVPAAASESVSGLVGWASTLPASETTQPLLTDQFNPQVDDTAQPMPIS